MRSPEGNGCIERFIRTLKEQLLWLIQRHGYLSPAQARAKLSAIVEVAA